MDFSTDISDIVGTMGSNETLGVSKEIEPLKKSLGGALEHEFYFPIQLGMSSSQLTFIFLRGYETTN